MIGYLNITGLEVALLLNFKEAALGWKRVVTGKSENEAAIDAAQTQSGDVKGLNP